MKYIIPEYIIITRNKTYESDPEDIVEEQYEKREILGLNGDNYLCHYFNSGFYDDHMMECNIDDAIQHLACKDGVDMVQFENGNYGFVAYYSGEENAFEIIR